MALWSGKGRIKVQQSDAELVDAASRGDLNSFGLLYERHYRMAVAIARSRLADWHLAEDVAQEAFAIACRSLSTLQNRRRFPQWLATICRRTASRLQAERPKHQTLDEEPASVATSEASALHNQVQDALQLLKATPREIVVLHYFGQLSYEEISEALCGSIPSIHGHLQRARAKLASALGPQTTLKE